MDKKVIGIVPRSYLYLSNDPYEDRYMFVNNYPKKVYEAGAIPIGLLLNDGMLSTDQLDLCDAFIIPGGNKVNLYILQLLEYAKDNNKPVLGVCMGIQAMSIYSLLLDEELDPFDTQLLDAEYDDIKEEGPLLSKVDKKHYLFQDVTRTNYELARHEIEFKNDSLISELYDSNKINGVSFHSLAVNRVGSLLDIVGRTPDGSIEAVENKDLLWIGVQFHPEVDDKDPLINNFIKKIEERRNIYDRH